jgi:hypothetical protein
MNNFNNNSTATTIRKYLEWSEKKLEEEKNKPKPSFPPQQIKPRISSSVLNKKSIPKYLENEASSNGISISQLLEKIENDIKSKNLIIIKKIIKNGI